MQNICQARRSHGTWAYWGGLGTCRDCGKTTQEVNPHEFAREAARAPAPRGEMSESRLNSYLATAALKG